jgi:aldehyde dehydrogenase (NAD+)
MSCLTSVITVSFGPLISEAQRDKVLGYIEDAKQNGATIATGGGKWDQSEGFYIVRGL